MKIFVSDFCEDDAAIQAYCKEDEQKDAEKMPPKAWFVFFPYSIRIFDFSNVPCSCAGA